MSDRITAAIERLARILEMRAHDPVAVLNEAIQRLVAGAPIQDVRRLGRVLNHKIEREGNERDIARVDRTAIIPKGTLVSSHGRMRPTQTRQTKTTRGYRVQFKHQGKWYRKFFSDSKHGGPFGARAAARRWRDETERQIGRNIVSVRVNVQTYNAEAVR